MGSTMSNESNLANRVEVTQFVLPENLNHMGNMHGGEVLKLMDNTAGLAFIRYAGGNAVTAGVKEVKFIKPIPEKSIIKCVAEVVSTGRTSMEIKVEVFLEILGTLELIKAVEGTFTGVAIDEEGRPRAIRPLQ